MKIWKARSNGPNTGRKAWWWPWLATFVDVLKTLRTEMPVIHRKKSESLNWNHLMEVKTPGSRKCCLRELTYKLMVIEYAWICNVWYRNFEEASMIRWMDETVIIRGNGSLRYWMMPNYWNWPLHAFFHLLAGQPLQRFPMISWRDTTATVWGHSTLQMVTAQNLTRGSIETASFLLSTVYLESS